MDFIGKFISDPTVILVIGIIASIVIFLISLIHFYWSVGGKKGLKAAIPVYQGRPVFLASPVGVFAVAFFLLIGALVLLGKIGLFRDPNPREIYEWGPWILAALFTVRSIGDFRFVGLFRKVKDTYFSYWDTWLNTPLCIFLAIACGIVAAAPMK